MSSILNTNIKNKDIELWRQWKKTKSPIDLQNLLHQFEGTINNAVNKWSGGNIPRNVLEMEAKKLAIKAFETFQDNKGASLNTHVNNNLLALSRIVYTHQNVAKIPENLVLKLNSFQTAYNYLTDLHGREPTTDELQQELGWSPSEINRLQTYNRRDLIESKGELSGEFFSKLTDKEEAAFYAVYYDLSPIEKKILEYSTGYNGAPILSNPEICKRLGITQAQLSYQKRLLIDKIKKALIKIK